MKKTVSSRQIMIGISIITIVIGFLYWKNCNAYATVGYYQNTVESYLKSSTQQRYSAQKGQPGIVNNQLQNDRYVSSNVKKTVNDFFADWNKKDKLLPADSAKYSSGFSSAFPVLLNTQENLSINQGIAIFIICALIIISLSVAVFGNILRDIVGDPIRIQTERLFQSYRENPKPIDPPFSLSRTQFLVWITIIGCVYVYAVFWDNMNFRDINSTALILMGISVGTVTAGTILDTEEVQQNVKRNQDRPSISFLYDILSDANGLSINRFQNVVWTIIAIAVYFYRYENPVDPQTVATLPVLDYTLLALTGISSATYLTLKTRENLPVKNKVIKELIIKLDLGNTVTDAEKTELQKPERGMKDAIIDIRNDKPDETLHAVPSSSAILTFTVKDVPAGKYQKIEVSWKGIIITNSPERNLKGSYQGIIDENTALPVTIVLS